MDLKAKFAAAVSRSTTMLDPEAAREAVAAEKAAQPREHRDDGYSSDWHANMPKPEPAPAPKTEAITAVVNRAVAAALAAQPQALTADVIAKQTTEMLNGIRMAFDELAEALVKARGELRADVAKLDLRLCAMRQAQEKLERGLVDREHPARDVLDIESEGFRRVQ